MARSKKIPTGDGLTRAGEAKVRRNLKKQGPMFRKLMRGLDCSKILGQEALSLCRKKPRARKSP